MGCTLGRAPKGRRIRGWKREEDSVAKANKKLKKLGRADLLELLVEHSKEIERLKAELAESEAARAELAAANERLMCEASEAGLADGFSYGFTSVNGEAVRRVMSGTGRAVEEMIADARRQADGILYDAQRQADDILADAERQRLDIVADANDEAAVIRKYTKMLLVDSKSEAAHLKGSAQQDSDRLLAQTRTICSDLLAQAQSEIDALFDEADARAAGGSR